MSYYDPRIYNFHNLEVDDKLVILDMLRLVDSVKNLMKSYEPENEMSHLEKNFYETANFVSDQILQTLNNGIIEYIVKYMEPYEDNVEEMDIDDYFYGI